MTYTIRFDSEDGDPRPEREERWDEVRLDLSSLRKPQLTSDGFVRAQGFITRSGIFIYHDRLGNEIRELRSDEEVFSSDSLSSFGQVPLTLDHPPQNLTPRTVQMFQVGSVGKPRRDGNMAKADILITSHDAVQALLSGVQELSCGYTCQVSDRSGTLIHEDGTEEQFDTVQSNIRGNHVAIVERGRAGPSARIRVDENETPQGEINEVKMSDKKVETTNETSSAVSKTDDSELKNKLDTQSKELEQLKGKVAALEAEKDRLEKEASEQVKVDSDKEEITTRLRLIAQVAPRLDAKFEDLVDLDELELMKKVVTKETDKVDLEGKSDDFVRGMFAHITSIEVKNPAAEINAAVGNAREDAKGGDEDPIAAAEARMKERNATAWKPIRREVSN